MALSVIACGPTVQDPNGGVGASSSNQVECLPGQRRLADDACQVCSCLGGAWDCPEAQAECEVACVDGDVIPAAGNCGWCTCIEDAWLCDGTESCECEYDASQYDPSSCNEGVCTPFGSLETGCGGTGGIAFDDDIPGADPFVVSQIVPCERAVPRLGEGSPGRVLDAKLIGDELSLTLEHEGGCADHRFGLCFADNSYWGYPDEFEEGVRTMQVQVAHDRVDDVCGQLVTTTQTFEISPAVEVYTQRMEDVGLERGDRMLFDVWSYGAASERELLPYIFED